MRPLPSAALALVLLLPLALPASAAEGQVEGLASPTQLPLADVAYRPDGRLALAVGGAPGQGVVLRVADGQASVARQDASRWLGVAWNPAGTSALLVGDAGVLRTADGVAFEALPLPSAIGAFEGRAVAWAPDGSRALLAGSALLRYTAASGALDVVRASADEAFGAVAWKPDGSYALVEQAVRSNGAWTTGRLLTWDGSQLRHVATYGSGGGLVEAIAWDGAAALVLGYDAGAGPVLRWDGAQLTQAFAKPADRFTAMAWRPGAREALLTGSGAPVLARSDGSSYAPLLDQGDLLGVAWHPSGAHALLVGVGGALLRWNAEGRPTVGLVAPLAGQVLAGNVQVLARAEAAGKPVEGVELRLDEGPWRALAAPPAGQAEWRLLLDTLALADGAHLLEVRARDAAGPGEAARLQVRVLNGAPAPPRLVDTPASDADGVVPLRWTATGADVYEVQAARDPGFAQPREPLRVRDPAATLHLGELGTHYVRVRAWVGTAASAWSDSAAVEVTLTASPFLPEQGAAEDPGDAPARLGTGEERGTPAPGTVLLLAGLGAMALAARRRRG